MLTFFAFITLIHYLLLFLIWGGYGGVEDDNIEGERAKATPQARLLRLIHKGLLLSEDVSIAFQLL